MFTYMYIYIFPTALSPTKREQWSDCFTFSEIIVFFSSVRAVWIIVISYVQEIFDLRLLNLGDYLFAWLLISGNFFYFCSEARFITSRCSLKSFLLMIMIMSSLYSEAWKLYPYLKSSLFSYFLFLAFCFWFFNILFSFLFAMLMNESQVEAEIRRNCLCWWNTNFQIH